MPSPVTPPEALEARALSPKSVSLTIPEKAGSKAAAVAAISAGTYAAAEARVTLSLIRAERAELEASKLHWLDSINNHKKSQDNQWQKWKDTMEETHKAHMRKSQEAQTAEFSQRESDSKSKLAELQAMLDEERIARAAENLEHAQKLESANQQLAETLQQCKEANSRPVKCNGNVCA